ncbi:hypothetical protein [Streptomyces sp. NPDC058731]|uniref:hypothetical protein n=1 Tax=Streptomyces sp. NPDC058731 TaxID=3346613 RepID=UPI0036816F74
MTCQYADEFDPGRAVARIRALLGEPLPTQGPSVVEEDPLTGERVKETGAGFVLARLWQSRDLTGVYGEEWNAVVRSADLRAEEVARELARRWGPPRRVAMHGAMFRHQAGEPLPPLHQALCDADDYGDLTVWGPVQEGPGGADRWVGISVGHSDGDAPLVLMGAVSDREITEVAGEPR